MPKYAIAFIVPSKSNKIQAVRHRVIDGDVKETALRRFFDEELKEYYSEDDQGFFYFKEDFFDENTQSGSIIEL